MKTNTYIPNSMVPPTGNSNLWKELYALWHQLPYQEVAIDYTDLLQTNPVLGKMLDCSPCINWIFDIRTMRYAYMSPQMEHQVGYPARQFQDKGIAFLNEIVHPDDLPRIWKLFKTIWDFLLALPASERLSYKFSLDYRLLKPDGTCIRFLEQSSVLQVDNRGNITHLLGVGSDITHWKNNETILATITSVKDGSSFFCTSEDVNLKPQTLLSKREREVMRLVAAGYNSRHIANELFISVHTVNTHRQNIIEKTHVNNTGGLVQYALSHGLL